VVAFVAVENQQPVFALYPGHRMVVVVPRSDPVAARKSTAGYGNNQGSGTYKSLVEPSVFNMSLLLPPTLIFLQRLKNIVKVLNPF
jgi:exocyst complex component 4